jgi:tRNA nucleotidyltransferase/poly(A) polymerase
MKMILAHSSDPFNGLADLQAKIIKTPLEPGITL